MKKCNTEIMKDLKVLADKKDQLRKNENKCAFVTYSPEETPIETDYSFEETNRILYELEKEERRLKALLAYSNATTIIDGYDITIGEGLVMLAQLGNQKLRLETLKNAKPKERYVNYRGFAEYKEAHFDIDKANQEYDRVILEISRLQMAIDRTNLTNMIEV